MIVRSAGHAFARNKQISGRGGSLGSLDASLHLYKTFYPSISLSVHRSVSHASVKINLIKSNLQEVKKFYHVIIQKRRYHEDAFLALWALFIFHQDFGDLLYRKDRPSMAIDV